MKENKKIDLSEITGQESGIVVYPDGNTIICNWSHDTGFPRVWTTGLIFNNDLEFELINTKEVKNISEYIGDNLIYDTNGDADTIEGTTGTIYTFRDINDSDEITVIAPNDWA